LGTAFPGNAGNFAVAGHRATHGEPFARFDLLNEGDEVVVETVDGLFTYSLVTDSKVTPEDVWVVGPRPDIDQLKSLPPGSKIITLTTCDPRWSSENRWVWFGVLDSFVPRAEMKEAN
jgi:sortase A